MMIQEFTERTGFEPTMEEYSEIEQAYYEFGGDKNAFCKAFVENNGAQQIYDLRAEKVEWYKAELKKVTEAKDAEIAELETKLEQEQEWKPFEDEHNVKQADYEKLAAQSDTKVLTDDEAANLISAWFGFEKGRIQIVHEVVKEEINRHRECRRVGTYERKALYNSSDWNYIVFNVRGLVATGYEMHNGELQMYWG